MIFIGLLCIVVSIVLFFAALFHLYSLVGTIDPASKAALEQSFAMVQFTHYFCYGLGTLGLVIFIWGIMRQERQARVQSK
jgi:hypothetical protein